MIVQGNFLQRRYKSYQRNIIKEYFMNKEVGVLLGDRGGGGPQASMDQFTNICSGNNIKQYRNLSISNEKPKTDKCEIITVI